MKKPWANFLNEYSEDHYIPYTESCPFCKEATPIAWKGWEITKKGLANPVELDVWYCPLCDNVLNFDEDGPKAEITWLTVKEAKEKGIETLENN